MTRATRHLLEIVFRQLGRDLQITPPRHLKELHGPINLSPAVLASMIVLGQEAGGDGVTLGPLIEFLHQVEKEISRDPAFLAPFQDVMLTQTAA